MEVWTYESMKVWKYESMEVWKYGRGNSGSGGNSVDFLTYLKYDDGGIWSLTDLQRIKALRLRNGLARLRRLTRLITSLCAAIDVGEAQKSFYGRI